MQYSTLSVWQFNFCTSVIRGLPAEIHKKYHLLSFETCRKQYYYSRLVTCYGMKIRGW